MDYIIIDPQSGESKQFSNDHISDFLENNLDQFGDKKEYILKAIEYALNPDRGGLILLCIENDQIIGAVVINKTGMDGYIPSNILVYIAVHKEHRGKGLGRKLMLEVMNKTKGGIALHVEPENPAKYLYEKLGFTHKYLEMRYVHN
ncbi:MAG: GNAT family N-acetyltransferase [Ignavibacteria bacterium]|nr:GNAT family N-acetyltransferase [Ignavibacteria bacterium]